MNRDWKEGELAYIRFIVHEADLKLILNKKKKNCYTYLYNVIIQDGMF